jgi:hypothetical protein
MNNRRKYSWPVVQKEGRIRTEKRDNLYKEWK